MEACRVRDNSFLPLTNVFIQRKLGFEKKFQNLNFGHWSYIYKNGSNFERHCLCGTLEYLVLIIIVFIYLSSYF